MLEIIKDSVFFICNDCGENINIKDIKKFNSEYYCNKCYSKLKKCSNCGSVLSQDEESNMIYNKCYCNSCYENFPTCFDCGGKVDKDSNIHAYIDNNLICCNCMDNYKHCSCCNKLCSDTTTINNGDEICNDCLEEHYFHCEICNEYYSNDELNEVNYIAICDDCFHENYFYCERCGELYSYDECASGQTDVCKNCHNEYIHDYFYKPSPEFHSLDYESTNFFIGVELEICGRGFGNCATELFEKCPFVYCKEDGSLSEDGIEIVSHPATFLYHTTTDDWKNIFEILEVNNMNDITNCGLHFHISKDSLNFENMRVLDYFVNNNADLMEETGGRKLGSYCHQRSKDLDSWGLCNNSSHGDSVNLSNQNTVEIRFCKSTPDFYTFIKRLTFIYNIVNFCKSVTFKDITSKNNKTLFENYLKSLN